MTLPRHIRRDADEIRTTAAAGTGRPWNPVGTTAARRSFITALLLAAASAGAADTVPPPEPEVFDRTVLPLLKEYCWKCHSAEKHKGDLDLEPFTSAASVLAHPKVWQGAAEQLANKEMPPKEKPQPTEAQRTTMLEWVNSALDAAALAHAGDPGPVVLRRLSNAEYNYTVNDLTGLDLDPTREFPVDGAAGEGFMNSGNALVMSPALLGKYLDAGKDLAAHLVLLPEGVRFSPHTTRRDWTDDALKEIRSLYARHSDDDGKLPLVKYITATLESRDELASAAGAAKVAEKRGLNPRYLQSLWTLLHSGAPSPILDPIRERWKKAATADATGIAGEIEQWQKAVWKFNNVGHMKSWMEPVNPVTTTQELRYKLASEGGRPDITATLSASAGAGGVVVWKEPRIQFPGRPSLPLRSLQSAVARLEERRKKELPKTAAYLAAAHEAAQPQAPEPAELAKRHRLDPDVLLAWLDYLGIGPASAVKLQGHFTTTLKKVSGFEFVSGWGSSETPSLFANSSDQHVRIPGNLRAHSIAVHPSPTLQSAVGWRSPITGQVSISGQVVHAHPECGNGISWSLEVRHGVTRKKLAGGNTAGPKEIKVGPFDSIAVREGDLVSLLIGPRDGNHSCDLTAVDLTVTESSGSTRKWDLAADVSGNVLAGNPHADRLGNEGVWNFYTEPTSGGSDGGPVVPAGSALARWQSAGQPATRQQIAVEVQKVLVSPALSDKESPDARLHRQLTPLNGPLFAGSRFNQWPGAGSKPSGKGSAGWGLDPAAFGRHPSGAKLDPSSLCVRGSTNLTFRLPSELVEGCELVTTATMHAESSPEASAQVRILGIPQPTGSGLLAGQPILVADTAPARDRIQGALDEFRSWFPAALCYRKIVPVDEVVTLTLFHREDEALARLMLTEAERKRLDAVWDELHFVSQDAFTQQDAFAQLMEFATQDADPRVFEPFRVPIRERAAAFRKQLVDVEPKHLDAVVALATRAYRRPLTEAESGELRHLYQQLREQTLPHEEALRLTLARVFISPAFLYRPEKSAPGTESAPISDYELASRLSYFLWSSMPDDELLSAARKGRLHDPEVLVAQGHRMLGDARVRRLATEFACQWLHVHNFVALDEKSERHFPTFGPLRGAMYEEVIRFFVDFFQKDRPVLSILNADHSYLNGPLAVHYGIPGVTGDEWRRVDGLNRYGRGGVLGFAATLAKQAGASRTSPILRGNWVGETLLGDKLPKPPKDVPRLPEDEGTETLTIRQLVEKHSTDSRCYGCHARIDPMGFSLERFDAIGRHRDRDLGDRPIDTQVKTLDGAQFDGMEGLRDYLLTQRREAFVRQFARKLLGYALGRGVQLSDGPLLKEIRQQLKSNDYRVTVAVDLILRSRQFREIRGKNMATED